MLSYTIYKQHDDLDWVTFIHGAGGSSSIWYKQLRDFKRHFNVLLIDLRGHGKSKQPFQDTTQKSTPSTNSEMR
jgi:pimeloyl-ACP methyl ester carboxylesterase